jgi:cell division protein FtsQ
MIKKQWGRKNRRLKEPFFVRARRRMVRSLKAACVVLVLPVSAISLWAAYGELTTTKLLAINTVEVSGLKRVSKNDVMALAGIYEGQNLLSFKPGSAESGLRKNPWIKYAKVSRLIPDTVSIELKERIPAALVKLDAMYVMDEDGVIFKEFTNSDNLDLPVVTGLTSEMMKLDEDGAQRGLLDLIRVLNTRAGFNSHGVSEIHMDPAYGFSIYTLNEGVKVDLGRDAFEEKLAVFERIMASRGGRLNGVEAMRITGAREAIVRFGSNVL